jgi:hypothetical protein
LKLAVLGRDQTTLLRAGDVVEVGDDAQELGPGRGFLTTLADDPDPDEFTVTLAAPLPDVFASDKDTLAARHTVLRRWDGTRVAGVAESDLGDGIRVQFGGYDLRPGDYWQFAARGNAGTVEHLKDAKPHGIRRYRCPLAVANWTKEFAPGGDRAKALQLLKDQHILEEPEFQQLQTEVNGLPGSELVWADFLTRVKAAGATDDQVAALKAVLEASEPLNLKFVVDHDCRRKFTPLADVPRPQPELTYVGGDAQEAAEDGRLLLPLEVAVTQGGRPLPDQSVTFMIVGPGQGGKLNGNGQSVPLKTDPEGIATCTWQLDTVATAGQSFPPRVQRVEATLDGSPAPPPVHFHATLGLTRFCYVGGDGQEAGEKSALDNPLEVAVFNGYEPVKGAIIRFTTTGQNAKLDGDGAVPISGPNDVTIPTGADGVAACRWTLDPDAADQTVEARLLGAQGADDPILQPIHFHARRVWDAGLTITRVVLDGPGIDLTNNKPVRAPLLTDGISFILRPEPTEEVVVSPATCYLTVEVPPALPEGLGGLDGTVFVPLTLAAEVTFDADRITWRPLATPAQLAKLMPDNPQERWLARFTILGNFVATETGPGLDGDTFGAGGAPEKLRLPSGDGRAGGDFRMWFWLQRARLNVTAPVTDANVIEFGSVAQNAPGPQDKFVTLQAGPDAQEVTLHLDPPGQPFGLFDENMAPIGEGTQLELAANTDKKIKVVFAPTAPVGLGETKEFVARLRVRADSAQDSYVFGLHGTETPPVQ